MTRCEFLTACPFFNDKLANMPTMAEMLKNRFCFEHTDQCARYIVRKGGRTVPDDLFPNQYDRAVDLVGY